MPALDAAFFDGLGSVRVCLWQIAFAAAAAFHPLCANGEDLIHRNAGLQAIVDGGLSDAEVPRGGAERHEALPSNYNRNEVAAMLGALLVRGDPATISRAVALAGVDAVDLVSWRRAMPHVGQERLKRVVPLGSHFDAASAVPRIVLEGSVVAAALDAEPRLVLKRDSASALMSMHQLAACGHRVFLLRGLDRNIPQNVTPLNV